MFARSHQRFLLVACSLGLLVTLNTLAGPEKGKNPFPADWFWGEGEQRTKLDELIGTPMPDLDVTNWVNGAVSKDDLKGKIVVLDIWATWCGPCIASIPHNNEMMEKYKDQGVTILGVCSSKKGQEKMADVAKEHGIKYPTAQDPNLNVQKAWRLMWYPTYAVVDRDGMIRCIGLQPDKVEKVVEQLLQEQPYKGGTK